MFRRAIAHSSLALAFVTASSRAQQTAGRSFGIDDALNIRSSRIEDMSADGRWVALTACVRRVLRSALTTASSMAIPHMSRRHSPSSSR